MRIVSIFMYQVKFFQRIRGLRRVKFRASGARRSMLFVTRTCRLHNRSAATSVLVAVLARSRGEARHRTLQGLDTDECVYNFCFDVINVI